MHYSFFVLIALATGNALGMQAQATNQPINLINLNKQLLEASASGHIQQVQEALDKGADINTLSLIGNTPLHNATYYGTSELINTLLEHGADPQIKNKENKTPLDMARNVHKTEVINLLELYPQTSYEAITNPSQDTLLKAVQFGWTRIVQYLLQSGRIPLPKEHINQYLQLAQINYKKNENPAYRQIEQILKQYKSNTTNSTETTNSTSSKPKPLTNLNNYFNKLKTSTKGI